MKIPEHYLPLMPYLIMKDTAIFREFVKNAFDAKEHFIVPDGNDGVMHGEIKNTEPETGTTPAHT